MIKKLLPFAIIILFVGTNFVSGLNIQLKNTTNPFSSNCGNTLYVGGYGPGNYSKIQDAINDAVNGDTVFVYDDSSPYFENVMIHKSISLIGKDKNTTVIDANYTDYPIYMSSTNYAKISGFTLINPQSPPYNAWESVVIKIINCHNSIIENNIIKQNLKFSDLNAGIYLSNSENNSIRNNIIFNNRVGGSSRGIELHDGAKFNNISNNEIYNFYKGIEIYSYYNHDANDNTIYGNYIYHNFWGVEIIGGNNGKIINNIVTANRYNGIIIRSWNIFVSGNIISNNGAGGIYDNGLEIIGGGTNIINNHISNNDPTGITLFVYSANNQIIHNNITINKQIGIYVCFSQKNIVSYNNFIDNGNYNACFENLGNCSFSIKWNKNYWSDNNGKSFYKIPGYIYVFGIELFRIPWFNYDWNPVLEPYKVPGKSNYVEGCVIE